MICAITMKMAGFNLQLSQVDQGVLIGFFMGAGFGIFITVIVATLAANKRDKLIRQGKYIEVDGSIKEEKANEDNPIV